MRNYQIQIIAIILLTSLIGLLILMNLMVKEHEVTLKKETVHAIDSMQIIQFRQDSLIERIQKSNSECWDLLNVQRLCPKCVDDSYRHKHPDKCRILKPKY